MICNYTRFLNCASTLQFVPSSMLHSTEVNHYNYIKEKKIQLDTKENNYNNNSNMRKMSLCRRQSKSKNDEKTPDETMPCLTARHFIRYQPYIHIWIWCSEGYSGTQNFFMAFKNAPKKKKQKKALKKPPSICSFLFFIFREVGVVFFPSLRRFLATTQKKKTSKQ